MERRVIIPPSKPLKPDGGVEVEVEEPADARMLC